MKIKTAKIFGILISVLVLFASCGQLAGSGESRVSINLPYVNNANGRTVSSDALQRIKGEHASYRVHINDRVLEGAGGNFSAYFPVGTKVDVFIECVNAKGEVILRTVTKSLVVASGENVINFNLKADGTEITPPSPPSPTIEYVNITYNQGFVYTNTVHQSPNTWQNMTSATLPNSGQREKGSAVSADPATATGYVFKGWIEDSQSPSGDAPDAQNFNYVQNYDSDMTLYAIWEQLEPGSHSVKFAGGTTTGSSVSGLPHGFQQQENTQATFSGTPTCPGYEFAGWSADVSGVNVTQQGNSWTFTMPTSDVTLTAQWTLKNYTVTFNTDGGSSVNSITDFNINYGGAFSNSTKPGYSFQSWQTGGTDYTASTLKDAIKAGTVGSTSTTIALTARWDELSTLYVSDSGIDSNSGESASPLTITKAFEIASASSTAKTIEVGSNINDVVITQTGGNITLNLGGNTLTGDVSSAVITITGGELTLEDRNGGGKITGGCRGVLVQNATFTMSSGEISNNTSAYSGIGVWVEDNGTFTMTGGKICNNIATVSGNGGGVNTRGTFTMSGGEISGNEAAGSGGGVEFEGGNFTMSGSAVIRNNTANYGGGVYVNSRGTIAMNGGAIEGNTATSHGGGICVNSATGCAFEMNAGTISNNTARNGSGVYTSGTFTMNGGTISHHTAGYGVYLSNSGNPIFNGNGTGIFEDNSPGDYSGTYSGTQTDNSDSWTH